jgi:putative aldouronate transport system substrate-binding protein
LSYFGVVGKGVTSENDKIFFAPLDDRYKEYLKFMRKLYVEKLLDNESFIQDDNQLNAKGKANLVGVTGGWNAIAYQYSEGSDYDKIKGTSIPALTSEFSPNATYPLFPYIRTGRFAITKACKYPEVAFRWVDISYSGKTEDVLRIFWGGMWEWENEADRRWMGIVPEGMSNTIRNEWYTVGGDSETPYFADTATLDHQGGLTGLTDWYKLSDATRFVPYARSAIPVFALSTEELETAAIYGPDIYSYCNQMEAAFITGETDIDGGWNAFVNNLQNMKVNELVKVYQTGYDRYMAN